MVNRPSSLLEVLYKYPRIHVIRNNRRVIVILCWAIICGLFSSNVLFADDQTDNLQSVNQDAQNKLPSAETTVVMEEGNQEWGPPTGPYQPIRSMTFDKNENTKSKQVLPADATAFRAENQPDFSTSTFPDKNRANPPVPKVSNDDTLVPAPEKYAEDAGSLHSGSTDLNASPEYSTSSDLQYSGNVKILPTESTQIELNTGAVTLADQSQITESSQLDVYPPEGYGQGNLPDSIEGGAASTHHESINAAITDATQSGMQDSIKNNQASSIELPSHPKPFDSPGTPVRDDSSPVTYQDKNAAEFNHSSRPYAAPPYPMNRPGIFPPPGYATGMPPGNLYQNYQTPDGFRQSDGQNGQSKSAMAAPNPMNYGPGTFPPPGYGQGIPPEYHAKNMQESGDQPQQSAQSRFPPGFNNQPGMYPPSGYGQGIPPVSPYNSTNQSNAYDSANTVSPSDLSDANTPNAQWNDAMNNSLPPQAYYPPVMPGYGYPSYMGTPYNQSRYNQGPQFPMPWGPNPYMRQDYSSRNPGWSDNSYLDRNPGGWIPFDR